MDFSKKWLRNHQKFLLHFLIHIDVLMLCSKFELIPTSIFQVMAILRKRQKSQKYRPWIFPKNGSEITSNFYYIFLYMYILMQTLLPLISIGPILKKAKSVTESILPSVNHDKSSLTDNVLSAGNDPSKSMEVLIVIML